MGTYSKLFPLLYRYHKYKYFQYTIAPGTFTKSGSMSGASSGTVYAYADAYASGTWTLAYSRIDW